MSEAKTLKVGSRKSELALIQTNHVISELQKLHPDHKVRIVCPRSRVRVTKEIDKTSLKVVVLDNKTTFG